MEIVTKEVPNTPEMHKLLHYFGVEILTANNEAIVIRFNHEEGVAIYKNMDLIKDVLSTSGYVQWGT